MSYKLFLDDLRDPKDCIFYMHQILGNRNPGGFLLSPLYEDKDWVIVRGYQDFSQVLIDRGLPDLISFDHDLGMSVIELNGKQWLYKEDNSEFTGYDCAKVLIDYCTNNNLPLPNYIVHSSNPVGSENIISLLENYKKQIV